jgi:hypothetical protein
MPDQCFAIPKDQRVPCDNSQSPDGGWKNSVESCVALRGCCYTVEDGTARCFRPSSAVADKAAGIIAMSLGQFVPGPFQGSMLADSDFEELKVCDSLITFSFIKFG